MTCANDASCAVKDIGQVAATSTVENIVTLEKVLYVPSIRKNLISISTIATCGYRIVFFYNACLSTCSYLRDSSVTNYCLQPMRVV